MGNSSFFSSENSERYTVEVFSKSELGVKFKKTEFCGTTPKPGQALGGVEYLQIAKVRSIYRTERSEARALASTEGAKRQRTPT